jgi:nucleoside-diphosphate-sugar epimerase
MNGDLTAYAGVRCLVLGASGFIGGAVVRALGRGGADIHCAGRAAAGSANGTQHHQDLTDLAGTEALVRRLNPAIVFNAAGYGVDPAEKRAADPGLAARLNAELPERLVAVLAGVAVPWTGARMVHSGSVLEYGPIGGVLRESVPGRPVGLYGTTKLDGTTRIARACERSGHRALTARLAHV